MDSLSRGEGKIKDKTFGKQVYIMDRQERGPAANYPGDGLFEIRISERIRERPPQFRHQALISVRSCHELLKWIKQNGEGSDADWREIQDGREAVRRRAQNGAGKPGPNKGKDF